MLIVKRFKARCNNCNCLLNLKKTEEGDFLPKFCPRCQLYITHVDNEEEEEEVIMFVEEKN